MTTADLKAGISDLARSSEKMMMLALGWKLMEMLKEVGRGTPEIERQAWLRKIQRNKKLGKSECIQSGDRAHVKSLLEIRVFETRKDWENARIEYRRKLEVLNRTYLGGDLEKEYKE